MTVSYTHLDVYKRQVADKTADCARQHHTQIHDARSKGIMCHLAVSYTHLDVYKRQLQRFRREGQVNRLFGLFHGHGQTVLSPVNEHVIPSVSYTHLRFVRPLFPVDVMRYDDGVVNDVGNRQDDGKNEI